MEITTRRTTTRDQVGGRRGPVELEERLVIVQFVDRSEATRLADSGIFARRMSVFEIPSSMETLQSLKENMAEERKDDRRAEENERKENERKENERKKKEKEERRAEERRWEEERERRRRWEEEKRREDRHDSRRSRDDRDDRRESNRRSRSPRNAFPEVRNRLPRFFQNCLAVSKL